MHSVKKEENLIQYIYIYRGRLSKSFLFVNDQHLLTKKKIYLSINQKLYSCFKVWLSVTKHFFSFEFL